MILVTAQRTGHPVTYRVIVYRRFTVLRYLIHADGTADLTSQLAAIYRRYRPWLGNVLARMDLAGDGDLLACVDTNGDRGRLIGVITAAPYYRGMR